MITGNGFDGVLLEPSIIDGVDGLLECILHDVREIMEDSISSSAKI